MVPAPDHTEPDTTRRSAHARPRDRSGARWRTGGRVGRWLRPARGRDSDQGAAFLETAAVLVLAAALLTTIYNLELSQTFNNGVRQMICLIEGPECGEETWVDADRPDDPEEHEWGSGSENTADNQAAAMSMAQDRGWTDSEWTCLDNLWSAVSGYDHTHTDSDDGTIGIPGFNPDVHGSVPGGFEDSASTQISWGLDHIESTHQTPCVAWQYWQGTHTY